MPSTHYLYPIPGAVTRIFDNMNVEKASKLRHAYRKAANDIAKEVPYLIEAEASLPPRNLEMTRIQLFETFTTIKKLNIE